MKPLNIFVVHPSDTITDHLPHGAGWIDYNYLRGLAERGHTVHIAAPRSALRDPLPTGMHLHLIAGTGPDSPGGFTRLRYMWGVRRLLRRLSRDVRFDLAQQFTPVETGLSLALLGTGIPLVLGPYSGHWPAEASGPVSTPGAIERLRHGVRDAIARFQQSFADALVTTCPAAIERIRSPRVREERVHVISHGIHCHDYPARHSLPEDPSILFLASLEYRKGIFTLLEAFDAVAAQVPGSTLEIWGRGGEAQAVAERVARSPYHDRIHLHGNARREDVARIMRAHSVYCMPSHGEPFGMTLLEAMASAVPIVTTDMGGPPFIVHEAGGRVVPVGNAAALADALIEILSNRVLQAAMGSYNRARVEEEFDWRRSLDRMESVYAQILRRESPTPAAKLPDTRWKAV